MLTAAALSYNARPVLSFATMKPFEISPVGKLAMRHTREIALCEVREVRKASR
jgi:hypothetical protein